VTALICYRLFIKMIRPRNQSLQYYQSVLTTSDPELVVKCVRGDAFPFGSTHGSYYYR
jgi:hypothetical protein